LTAIDNANDMLEQVECQALSFSSAAIISGDVTEPGLYRDDGNKAVV
jgi:hypothetical protein